MFLKIKNGTKMFCLTKNPLETAPLFFTKKVLTTHTSNRLTLKLKLF